MRLTICDPTVSEMEAVARQDPSAWSAESLNRLLDTSSDVPADEPADLTAFEHALAEHEGLYRRRRRKL